MFHLKTPNGDQSASAKMYQMASLGMANPSGWMTSELFFQTLKHFIQYMNVPKEKRALLLIDNHVSHLSVQSMNLAKKSGLILVTFPPHCSHMLQPLDISIYGSLKWYYNSACNDWLLNHPGRTLSIYDVAGVSTQAYHKAFTPENVVAGFKKSGIFPLNRDIFLDDDFLPALPIEQVSSANP